ncbi:MAG: hypothetical protein ACM3ZE_04785, partial [Myxococcales bacterium]
PPERVFLRYKVEPTCPIRSVFVERFHSHSGLALLVDEPAPMVLDVQAGLTERGAWGELRFGDTGGTGVARRVAGTDCAEVVAGLVLIAVVALDPRANAAAAGTRPSPENTASLSPQTQPLRDAELPAHQSSASRSSTTPHDASSAASAGPKATARDARDLTRNDRATPSRSQPGPTPAHHHSPVVVSVAAGAEMRTPDSPRLSLAFILGGRIALERAWRPALGFGVGYSTSAWGDTGAGEARFTLWFTRVEVWPHVVRWGDFELGAYLGLEIGRLTGRYRSDHGEFVQSSTPASTGWWGLTQVVSFGYSAGRRLAVAAQAGVIEPLWRDYFYLDRPRLDVHRIPSIGLMGGLGASCRFE